MALEPGQQLLHYRIVEKIGEGGMGVVWKATDTNLDREVAIKVLPEAFANDTERVARFQREAKLLASLNHTGIAAIYGLQEQPSTSAGPEGARQAGLRFLAMELVPGEELSQRIARGALPVDEALEVAAQIATALEAAHVRGIVHRDLKPANVKLTPEDTVKVLDFGLAKAWATEADKGQADLAMSPTMTSAGSVVGMILGTASYMAPEQARGREVDQRADVWALGVILFEMLTGRAVFPGEDVSEVLAGVIKSDPDWSALPADLPRSVRLALRRCLERKPEERLHSAADLRILIDEGRRELQTETEEVPALSVAARARSPRLPWVLLGATLIAAAGLLWWWSGRGGPATAAEPVAFQLEAPPGSAFVLSIAPFFDVTPDDRSIVYTALDASGRRHLFVREFDSLEARPLAGTAGAEAPFIAPDGTIGFVADSQLRSIRMDGAGSTVICEVADAFFGGAFAPDGSIVFNDDFDAGLKHVRAPGAEAETLTTPDRAQREVRHMTPYVLPGGEGVVFTVEYSGTAAEPGGTRETALLRFDTGEITTLLDDASGPYRYLPSGHLLMRRAYRLIALPFDVTKMASTGAPFNFFGDAEIPMFSFAASSSTLAFSWDSPFSTEGLVWLDREGNELPITEERGSYLYPSLSPDGRRLSVSHHGQVWIYELGEEGRRTRLTQEGTSIVSVFSPDASRIAFGSYQPDENLYWMSADGGPMELLLESENRQYPLDWDEGGNRLVLQWTDPKSGYDIWTLALDGDREAGPLLDSPHNERWAQLSPDGRWLAYASDESGRYEIYVVSFPDLRGKRAVSIDGGIEPRWSPRGDEIFFKAGGEGELHRAHSTLMAAPVTGGSTLAFGTPQVLFEGDYVAGACCGPSYDVGPDGQRFVMTKGIAESTWRLNVVLNAFDGLEAR